MKIKLEEFEGIKYKLWDFLDTDKNEDIFKTRLREIFIKYQVALKNGANYIELDELQNKTYLEFKGIIERGEI